MFVVGYVSLQSFAVWMKKAQLFHKDPSAQLNINKEHSGGVLIFKFNANDFQWQWFLYFTLVLVWWLFECEIYSSMCLLNMIQKYHPILVQEACCCFFLYFIRKSVAKNTIKIYNIHKNVYRSHDIAILECIYFIRFPHLLIVFIIVFLFLFC